MVNLRKAAEMALNYFESAYELDSHEIEIREALRQALAQPEHEQPKHWSDCAVYNEPAYPKGECDCGGFDPNNKWHGLTEKEAEKIAFNVIADGVSKILAQPEQAPVLAGSLSVRYFRGDKAMTDTYFEYLGDLSEGDYTLYTAPPKQPEQEPVAWMWKDGSLTSDPYEADGTWTKLYTAPPKREWVGLTKEEKFKVLKEFFGNSQQMIDAVEAKLKEKNT